MNPHAFSRFVSAVLCIAATAQAETPPSPDGTAAPATPIFGAGLSLPGTTFSPGIALPGWTFKGAAGGMDADADGWRAFRIRTGGRDGDPIINGRALFTDSGRGSDSSEPSGSVRAEWRLVPSADANLLETFVGFEIAGPAIAGGTALVDGKSIPIALDGKTAHLYRGPVTNLLLIGQDGSELVRLALDRPTRILLQDGAHWGAFHLTIRVFFAEGPLIGNREYAIGATISTPAAGPLELTPGEAVTIKAGPDWIPFQYNPWIEPGSALDFSSVLPHHAPAGKYGRLVAVGDHFEFEGLPGVPQRFYGVNLCGTANLPSSREAADRFVANIARVGYNSLRVHHHERTLLAEDGRPHPERGDTEPAPEQWEKFDNLVAACVENGVYLTTDLFVSRSHSTSWRSLGIDNDGYLSNTAHFKVLCVFWEPAYSNLCEWTRNFLGHVNPRTGRSLAEEPALVTLALVNEGNLGNWGGGFLRGLPGVQEAWEKWQADHPDIVAAVLGGSGGAAPRPLPIPDDLKATGDTPAGRHAGAFALFLAVREAFFFERLKAFVRDECGCKVPLSSLSCWYNPVQYQLPRTHFDYVDDHFYVDHPKFLDRAWSLPSSCANVNPVAGTAAGAKSVEWRRLMDKPFCLTEWNYSGPGRFRGVGGIATGALGALQNWSGMWRFAWSHGRSGIEKPETRTMGYFDMSGDPLGLAAERAALCLFLRRDLPVLPAEYPLVLDEASLLDPRTGAPTCEVPTALWAGWHARVGSAVVPAGGSGDAPRSLSAHLDTTAEQARVDLAALGAAEAAQGAVKIDADTGTFLIDTPRTAGGFAESGAHTAGPLRFELVAGGSGAEPPVVVPATVWVSSLDNKPIADSSRLLVTHLTDVQNSEIRYGDPSLTILLDWGHLPHLMRRGAAEIALSIKGGAGDVHPSFAVFRLSPSGRRLGTVPATFDTATGQLRFTARTDLDPAAASFLYEIVRE